MFQLIDLRLTPEEALQEDTIKKYAVRKLSINIGDISGIRIVRRSIDARQRQVMVDLQVQVWHNEPMPQTNPKKFHWPSVISAPEVIVVGSGPAGLFAALKLMELGLKPIIVERGKDVSERKKDIALLNRNEQLDDDSNYAFGEGGAGTFSDGKLYTRSKKRGDFRNFLELLYFHGSSENILIDAHPHIGTDKLPGIIRNIRNTIVTAGGEFLFRSRVVDFIINGDRIDGVILHDGTKLRGKAVILATGHSAKDVYHLLHEKGIELHAKTWAMGVRVEHPQELIDRIQYHTKDGRGLYLLAASYSFSHQVAGRGVYSFCMCPGGFIVPAMTGAEEMVINGMSPSQRNSPYANSGMVVEIRPEDLKGYEKYGVLAGLYYQQEVERLCFVNGGQGVIAPAQRLVDFVDGRLSFDLPETSYIPGVVAAPLHFILPDHISSRLREGFAYFGKRAKGFLCEEAVVLAAESRTSSPLRIPRDKDSYMHVSVKGLFPCGEGAGYAGGIASSAMDGERCAIGVAQYINKM